MQQTDMQGRRRIMVNNSWFKRLLYKIYKMQWCEEHHCNLEDVDEEIGINGECYVCYDEFIDNELKDEEVVKNLIERFVAPKNDGCSLCVLPQNNDSECHFVELKSPKMGIKKINFGVWHNRFMISLVSVLGTEMPLSIKIAYCPYCGKKLIYDGDDNTYNEYLSLVPANADYIPPNMSLEGCNFCKKTDYKTDALVMSGFNKNFGLSVKEIEVQLDADEKQLIVTFQSDNEIFTVTEDISYCPFCGYELATK